MPDAYRHKRVLCVFICFYFHFKTMLDCCNFGGGEMWPFGWTFVFKRELLIAFIFAIVVAILLDLLKRGSLAGVRQLRNWLADFSVGRLRRRIGTLETYRNRISVFASSDKALYLAMLQYIVVILTMICLATILFSLEFVARVSTAHYATSLLGAQGAFAACGFGVLTIAAFVGVSALIVGGLDTPERVAKKVSELDSEIASLRSKLDARLQKGEK